MKIAKIELLAVLMLLVAFPVLAQQADKAKGKAAPQPQPATMSAEEQAAAQKAALQMMTKGVDPAKAPADVKKMAMHVKAIMTAIAKNMPDCQEAVAAATAYASKHKAEIDALNARFKEIQKDPKSNKAMEYGRYMMALLMPSMMEMQEAMTQFSQKCTEQAKQLSKLLGGKMGQ
ncbi:MAG: hypothetical protein DRI34_03585 [Deltaproteobacteria bacterium]|nr:MAG: hypothetical protein DRI34_03585 [Deltaproteobacteria bacterium]